jgi:hypothetical protein
MPDALVARFRYREPLDNDQALGDVIERGARRTTNVLQSSTTVIEQLL